MKTIEELREDLDYKATELLWAKQNHDYHAGEALKAQAEVVKWREQVKGAEAALMVAMGESS
jgi:hypothetical protein